MVDTAPGLGEHVLAVLEQATDAVWVCGMDIPSIRGLRTGFQILTELDLMPENRHVVLNMADRKTGLTLQDVEATIGAPVDVVTASLTDASIFNKQRRSLCCRMAAGIRRVRASANSSSVSNRTGKHGHISGFTEGR